MNVKELRELLGHDVLLLAWPTRSKGTPCKWGHLTIADMVKPAYLANLERGNIGVVLGVKSGNLVALDLDDDKLVDPFLTANPFLADTLQTHGRRGRVFWLRMAGEYPAKTVKLKTHKPPPDDDAGEWRAGTNTQSIIHGIHPDTGKPYRMLNKCKPLVVEFSSIVWPNILKKHPACHDWTEETEVADEQMLPNVADEADVIVCGASVFSLIESVEDAVEKCLPTKVHENNLRLFDLARAVLTLKMKQIDCDEDEVFNLWYSKAKPFLRPGSTKEDYQMEFLNACHRAKVPLGSQIVASAWERAKQNPLPLPATAMAWENQERKLLVAFFREMQIAVGDKPFFVAGGQRACAKLLGHTSHSTVGTWVGAFCQLKFLRVVEKGDAHHATRFRYLGDLKA